MTDFCMGHSSYISTSPGGDAVYLGILLTGYIASQEFLLKGTPFCLPKPGPWGSGWASSACLWDLVLSSSSLLP